MTLGIFDSGIFDSGVFDGIGEDEDVAVLQGEFECVADYIGQFKSDRGKLSNSAIVLQDNRKYQVFSYVIKTSESITKWGDLFKKLVHPAGYGLFSEVAIETKIKTPIVVDLDTSIDIDYSNKITISTSLNTSSEYDINTENTISAVGYNRYDMLRRLEPDIPPLKTIEQIELDQQDATYIGRSDYNYSGTTNFGYWIEITPNDDINTFADKPITAFTFLGSLSDINYKPRNFAIENFYSEAELQYGITFSSKKIYIPDSTIECYSSTLPTPIFNLPLDGDLNLVAGSGVVNFSRATNKWVRNEEGYIIRLPSMAIEMAGYRSSINWFLDPDNIASSVNWAVSNVSKTSVLGVDNISYDACLLTVTSVAGGVYVRQSYNSLNIGGNSRTYKFLYKPGTAQWVRILFYDGTANRVSMWINVSTHVVGTVTSEGTGWSFSSYNLQPSTEFPGWYEVYLIATTPSAGTHYVQIGCVDNDNNISSSTTNGFTFTITRPQLEDSTGRTIKTPSEYFKMNTIASNKVVNNTALTSVSWTATEGIVTDNTTANPIDATVNAATFVPSVNAAAHYITQNITFDPAINAYKAEVYVKLISSIDKITLFPGGSSSFARFNLTTVTATRETNTSVAQISSMGGGWFKLEAIWVRTLAVDKLRIYASSGTNGDSTTAGDGISGVVIYAPIAGSMNTVIKYFKNYKNGNSIPESNLLGANLYPTAQTNNLLYCRDFTASSSRTGANVLPYWYCTSFGAELVSNGNFDIDTNGWNAVNATLSSVGGKLRIAPTTVNGQAQTSISTEIGTTYVVTGTLSNINGSAVAHTIRIGTSAGGNSLGQIDVRSVVGIEQKFIFTAETTTTHIGLYSSESVLYHEWDNISVKKSTIEPRLNQTGLDNQPNSCSILTATTNNAIILQNITAAAAPGCTGFYVKRSVGTGNIYITRDGGTSWTNITSQINSSTFSLVKIENTTVLNPVVGFKIETAGDAIVVDYGINHTGSKLYPNPIYTSLVAVTVNAEILSVQASGNVNNSVGTMVATIDKTGNWDVVGSLIGTTTRGLFSNASYIGEAKDGTNTIPGIQLVPSGRMTLGMRWKTNEQGIFTNNQTALLGAYDNNYDFGSTIYFLTDTPGIIKNIKIYDVFLETNQVLLIN